MDLLRGGLAVISGAYLVNTASKEDLRKLITNRKLAHGTIGALAGVFGGEHLEKLLKEGPGDKTKKIVFGGLAGATLLYFLSNGGEKKVKEYLGLNKNPPEGYQNV